MRFQVEVPDGVECGLTEELRQQQPELNASKRWQLVIQSQLGGWIEVTELTPVIDVPSAE